MLQTPTADKLRELKLYGMLKSFQEQCASTEYVDLSFEERLGLMVDREMIEQQNRRLSSRLKKAKLRQQACMENIDYRQRRNLDKSFIKTFTECMWVHDALNVLITGPCGVGKSFIACALAHKACLKGYTAFYVRAPRLFEDLAIAKGDGRYLRLINSLGRVNVLVIDDWGLSVLTDYQQRDFLEIMEDRHENGSTIITSQLPVEQWHEAIGNPTLADAILDRIVHNAYTINLTGESMRKKNRRKSSSE